MSGQWGTFEDYDEFFNPDQGGTPYLAWLMSVGGGKWHRYQLSFLNEKAAGFSLGAVRDGPDGSWVDDGEQDGLLVSYAGDPLPVEGVRTNAWMAGKSREMVPQMVKRMIELLDEQRRAAPGP